MLLKYNLGWCLMQWFFLQSLVSSQSRLVIASSESDPSTDNALSADAICVEVPTDDVRVGDSILVLPGETVPVDVSCLSSKLCSSSLIQNHQSLVTQSFDVRRLCCCYKNIVGSNFKVMVTCISFEYQYFALLFLYSLLIGRSLGFKTITLSKT